VTFWDVDSKSVEVDDVAARVLRQVYSILVAPFERHIKNIGTFYLLDVLVKSQVDLVNRLIRFMCQINVRIKQLPYSAAKAMNAVLYGETLSTAAAIFDLSS
jgi:hypothetical protein